MEKYKTLKIIVIKKRNGNLNEKKSYNNIYNGYAYYNFKYLITQSRNTEISYWSKHWF